MRLLPLLLLIGCSGARSERLFTCRACLADDANRCATKAQSCGDLPDDRASAEIGAKSALCDALTSDEIARRPTPPAYKPGGYFPNACHEWSDDAFTVACTPTMKKCAAGVPIH